MNINKIKLFLSIGVCFFTLMISSLAWADNIGFVDMQKVFLSFDEAKKAQENFQKKQEDYQKDIEKRQTQIEKAKESKKSEKEIKELITQLEKELEPKKEELLQLNQELTSKLRVKILAAAKKVATEYGIDVILDRQVVFIGGFDLTDFVLEKLNK